MADPGDITRLLHAWTEGGDAAALDRLMPLVFDELRRIARRQLGRADHTLQPTALVHEAYLGLIGSGRRSFEQRAQFFAFAARLIRDVLVDHARARGAAKRGGGQTHVPLLPDLDAGAGMDLDTVLAVDQALARLQASHPRQGRVAELRLFAGLSLAEIGQAIGRSVPTVERDWALARRRLARDLGPA